MKTSSHQGLALGLLASLLAVAPACGGGRTFVTPSALSEGRPARKVTATTGALEDEPFRATPPDPIAAKVRQLPLPTELRLSNGIRVVMLERHDFPSISAVLVLDRGAAAAPPGVAALYAEAMTGTSAEYKAAEAWQYLTFVGSTVGTDAWRDAVVLQVTALTPLFVSALSRAAPMFISSSLDGDDIDEGRTHLAAERARAGQDPSDVAADALYASVFPSPHPYGAPVSGDPAGTPVTTARGRHVDGALDRATNAAVRAFRDGSVSADHVGVACVGDFKPAWLQQVLEKALGKLPRRTTSAMPEFPALAKGGHKILVVDRPAAAQSSVAIGWPGPRASDRDSVVLDVLAAATAGDLATRLNITVRKELGASYGVRMAAVGLREGGIIRISAAVDTAKTVDAMRGLFAELERLRKEPLSDGELAAAKLRTSRDLDGSTRGLARYLAHAMAEGLPPAHVVTHNARVDVVTAEAVRAGAERYLARDEARIVVVGDASRILDGLRALGAGEVTVVR